MASEQLRIIPLGGLGEVGKNLLVVEYGLDLVVIDAGIGFPDEDMFGVDLLIPDISYLQERADRVRGIFITHGHEDHIGALSYLLETISAPIYSTRLTDGFIRMRLKERGLLEKADLRLLDPDIDHWVEAGAFQVRPFRVCHSIPDAIGVAIETPVGLIVHTGDFKLDPNPTLGQPTDLSYLEHLSERRPLLLISDCVHVETPGRTPSERLVEESFDRIIRQAPGRVIIATFASSISRVQQVFDSAARQGRRVACFGRSLQQNVRVALELGYLNPPDRTLIRPNETARYDPQQLVYLCTGSQGEPLAVLSRIALGEHANIQVQPNDTFVISATPIPGNETAVNKLLNNLFDQGATVIYPALDLVHVSGHASQHELETMLRTVKPRFVMPFHGEPRHLRLYRDLAVSCGYSPDRVLLGKNGSVFSYGSGFWTSDEQVASGTIFVGGGKVGAVEDTILRDRRFLARDGVISVSIAVDRFSGTLLGDPSVVGHGFASGSLNGNLLKQVGAHLADTLAYQNGDARSERILSRQIRDIVQGYIFQHTRRRPIVLSTVLEV